MDFRVPLKKNMEFISQREIPVADIDVLFTKSQTRFYLTVGTVDCPTGRLVVGDPLRYMAANRFCPHLEHKIPAGQYDVQVAICRNPMLGIRMCASKINITDKPAVVYRKAAATAETAIQTKEGPIDGFPVDAGMTAICDEQVLNEYLEFLNKWYQQNPDGNHYDDYFAAYFAESDKALPAYQREGGDFIQWANPLSSNRLVMVASGLGDGFYYPYWGYDERGEICQLMIPMVKPEFFEDI